jgi:hypothetical protein
VTHHNKETLSERQFQLLSQDVYSLILSFLESQDDWQRIWGGDSEKKNN